MHAGTTKAIDRQSGRVNGQASTQGNVAGAVERVPRGLLRIAENRVVEFLGLKAGTFDDLFGGDGTQLHRSEVLELAAIAAHRRACAADNRDIAWFQHGFL